MSRDPNLKRERNRAIKEAYAKLEAETVNGVRNIKVPKYSRAAILALLGRRFFLSPETLSNILLLPDDEDNERQLQMFDRD
jgi:hypothetical protein